MISVEWKYLNTKSIRNNEVVRSEVLACVILEIYLYNNEILVVGTDPSKKLPDIHNKNKTIGFEVVRCESEIDYEIEDFAKKLCEIEWDYNAYIELKKHNTNHIFNKSKLQYFKDGTIKKNRVQFHKNDWLNKLFSERLDNKLLKLNKGNYGACNEISLVMLSTYRMIDDNFADFISRLYKKECERFRIHFKDIYLITNKNIYTITKNGISKLSENIYQFDLCVKEMKRILDIDSS